MRKRLWCLLVLALVIVMGVANSGRSYAKTAENVEDKQEMMEICLYLGQHIPLTDLPKGTIILSQEKVVELSEKHVATAVGVGKVIISMKNLEAMTKDLFFLLTIWKNYGEYHE